MTKTFHNVRVVLLDIEGTTTPISFVYETLFPYARKRLRVFSRLGSNDPQLAAAMEMLAAERGADTTTPPTGDLIEYAEALMDRDAKAPGLKALQGLIWKVGYDSGALRSVIFDDVPDALRRWRADGIRVAIYSSGSVLAQRVIFGNTRSGDLTAQLDGFFDTAVGAKREPSSYRAICSAMGCKPVELLFMSDVMAELSAAREAGCQVVLISRPGNMPQSGVGDTPVAEDFTQISVSPRQS